ncbi:heavy-metal-associated domain-containing protein [Piscirickettsia litoralis]|uniref:HMA domain-containing protein n=1 Tax=Piscirickettsia litoralis TaxID=1891921 RepID=A0ABX3A3M9_9GAMM|nr:heavy metal-associated domain-containing protein [Piscirickettsia litoralis]ODN43481.1 hypothetical protein BGC07_11820 [Piscirickettsia litoralis]
MNQLKVNGLRCGSCVNKIETRLGNIAGISAVQVNLATGVIKFEGDRSVAAAAICDLGYDIAIPVESDSLSAQNYRLNVTGMRCASCVSKIETALSELNHVEEVSVLLAKGQVIVKTSDYKRVANTLAELGYPIESIDKALGKKRKHRRS